MKKIMVIIFFTFNFGYISASHSQIIVNDPALNAKGIIDYIEQLAQTVAQLEIAGLELSEWEQMWIEWQHTLDQALAFKEKFGKDAWGAGMDLHESQWGHTPLVSALRDFRGGDDSAFIAMTIELFESYLGGKPVEDVEKILTYLDSPEVKERSMKEIEIRNERDKMYRDSVAGSANVHYRNNLYRQQLAEIKKQGESLDNNSELATLQYQNKINTFMAQQQLEQQDLLSKIYGISQQNNLINNMDQIQYLEKMHKAKKDFHETFEVGETKGVTE